MTAMPAPEKSRPRGGPVGWLLGRPRSQTSGAYDAPGQGSSAWISVATVLALFALWWVASHLRWLPPLFLPTPEAVVSRFFRVLNEEFSGDTLLGHIYWSMYRVFTAFFLALVTAVPVGIAMGVSRVMRGIFDPPIEFYRPLPPLGYLPLTVIWFGIGETQKLVLLFLAMFAPIVLNTRAGVRSVAIEQIHAAYSLGASRARHRPPPARTRCR